MAYAPLIVTFPGGIGNPTGNPAGGLIPTSGGRRRQTRRANRKNRRIGCLARKNRRNTRRTRSRRA